MQNKERDNGSKGYPIGVAREHQDDEKGGSAPNLKSTPAEVPEPNQIGIGTAGTGKINYRPDGRDEHRDSAPHLVQRKTGLHGLSINPTRRTQQNIRSRTEQDLLSHDSDVPYAAVEKANRELICSLIERQDRVTERLLLQINDLQYRVDDLELSRRSLKKKKTCTGEGALK